MILLEALTAVEAIFELKDLTDEPSIQFAVPWLIPLISLATQVGGSVYSGIKSKQANDKAEKEVANLKNKQDEMYRQRMSEAETLKHTEGDFLNTALGKGLITEIEGQYRNAVKQGTANGLKREMTDEEKQSNVQTANRHFADTLRGVAQVGTNHRMGILNMVNQLKNGAYSGKSQSDINNANLRLGMAEAKNQSALNLGHNFNQVGTNLMNTASKWEGDGSWKNWFSSWKNKGNANNGMSKPQFSDSDYGAVGTDPFYSLIQEERNKPY